MTPHFPLSEGRNRPSGVLIQSKAMNLVTFHFAEDKPVTKTNQIMLSQNVVPPDFSPPKIYF